MKFKYQIIDSTFTKIYLKVYVNLVNLTGDSLSLDQFKKEFKIYILNCVLTELKSFLINELYYRSQNLPSNVEAYKFFELILLRVKKVFQKELNFLLKAEVSFSEFNWVVKYLEDENGELLNLVLSIINDTLHYEKPYFINGFDRIKLITALLENLILKISNVFIYLIFFNVQLQSLVFLNMFCPTMDFLKIQKNNFYWQVYLTYTFLKPKYIYYNVYTLKVLSKHGISTKLFYLCNLNRKVNYKFSNVQLAVLFYFEFIDFIYPKCFRIIQKARQFFYSSLN